MGRYIVKVKEEFTADLEVEAESIEDAKNKVRQDSLSIAENEVHWANNPDTFQVEEAYKKNY